MPRINVHLLNYCTHCTLHLYLSLSKGRGKGPILAIALLTWVRLVTRSALQSRKWQLTGTS